MAKINTKQLDDLLSSMIHHEKLRISVLKWGAIEKIALLGVILEKLKEGEGEDTVKIKEASFIIVGLLGIDINEVAKKLDSLIRNTLLN